MVAVNISTASVPADYCPGDLPTTWPFLVSLLSANAPFSAYNMGADTPAPDDQDKPWFKFDANGLPERWYAYVGGAWIARHPEAPGGIKLYLGTEASITTYDGGEAGTVTATTGPMWEKVSDFDAKFPVGVGSFASGTAVAASGTGGEEKHTITQAELPNVTLTVALQERTNVPGAGSNKAYSVEGNVAATPLVTSSLNGGVTQVAGNNLPPYVGTFFIRRTARTHYRV